MLYGNGAKILQAATPIATSEPDKYNAEKAKADKDFKQAKEYLTKAVELDPKDENSKEDPRFYQRHPEIRKRTLFIQKNLPDHIEK